MKQWHDIMQRALMYGVQRPDRTGVGTLALFGEQLVFENCNTFPAVTTKRLAFRQVCAELACFIRGYSRLEDFHRMGCTIWDGNAAQTSGSSFIPSKQGDLGRIYGVQWRDWVSAQRLPHQPVDLLRHTDQLQGLLAGMRKDPNSRRHLVLAYNPGELAQVCLPACHVLFQCFIHEGALDMRVDLRSVDLFLGLPFDIASYALLQRLLAKDLGLRSHKLVFQLGDAHIYLNHRDQAYEVLTRELRPLPMLSLVQEICTFDFLPEHAELLGYDPHGPIAAPLNL